MLAGNLARIGFDDGISLGSSGLSGLLHFLRFVLRVREADGMTLRLFLEPGFNDELFGVLAHEGRLAEKLVGIPTPDH